MSKVKGKRSKKLSSIGKVAIVDWEDHWSSNDGWEHVQDHTPMVCKSAGIIAYEDKKVLQITSAVDPAGKVSGVMTILKKNITKRRTV